MKYLFYNDTGEINLIYHEEPPKELGDKYVEYNGEIPHKNGCSTIIKVIDGNVVFDYEEIPPNPIQGKIQSLEEENAELLFKSAITDMKIEGLEEENAEMMFRLANLELGGSL